MNIRKWIDGVYISIAVLVGLLIGWVSTTFNLPTPSIPEKTYDEFVNDFYKDFSRKKFEDLKRLKRSSPHKKLTRKQMGKEIKETRKTFRKIAKICKTKQDNEMINKFIKLLYPEYYKRKRKK
jgi:hypothetical protein